MRRGRSRGRGEVEMEVHLKWDIKADPGCHEGFCLPPRTLRPLGEDLPIDLKCVLCTHQISA